MKIIHDWRAFPADLRGGVLCVGNFDGVHVGHAKMLSMGREEAAKRNASFTIMTFEPHPAVILRSGMMRAPLTTLEQRLELLGAFGADVVIAVPTTREFLAIQAEAFLQDVVGGVIGARVMVEGPTFTFGRGARGNVEMLLREGRGLGIEAIVVPTQEVVLSDLTVVNVSSSLTRWLIEHGRVRDAARCLGRAYSVRGEVMKGQQRGKALGFPTANVAIRQLSPAEGVYAGCVHVEGRGGGETKTGTSGGKNQPFPGKRKTVEAF
ncbi:MAG: hypothetical protein FWD61_07665, partial [Phycisphaerales bacterium]|nr:hypothetical protein [Phycisphaerales bacterium]